MVEGQAKLKARFTERAVKSVQDGHQISIRNFVQREFP